HFDRAGIGERAVEEVKCRKCGSVERSCARFRRRSSASFALDRRAPWRAGIRLTGRPENARSDGAPLHRQSGCPARNVRCRLHHSQTPRGANLRSCPAAPRELSEITRQISGDRTTEGWNSSVGERVWPGVAHASRVLAMASPPSRTFSETAPKPKP